MTTVIELYLAERGFDILKATVNLFLDKENPDMYLGIYEAFPVYPADIDYQPQAVYVESGLIGPVLRDWNRLFKVYVELACARGHRVDADMLNLHFQEEAIQNFFTKYCKWLTEIIVQEGYVSTIDVEARVQKLMGEV